jgi:hypothetical protein
MLFPVFHNDIGKISSGDNVANPTLQDLYASLQKEMRTKLEIGRNCIDHSTSKGDDSEKKWKRWFNEYLPNRYSAEKAFVIDSIGNISQQIDLVIYDKQYSPPIFKQNEFSFIPAESVYAVFEIKQTLNKISIDYTKDKVKSVRDLKRTSAPISSAGGTLKPLPPKPIFAGILTYNCEWVSPFGDSFNSAMSTDEPEEQIDFGCVICSGGFEKDHSNDEINYSRPEYSLVFFFLKLLSRLQSIGTVTAIDLSEYLRNIK